MKDAELEMSGFKLSVVPGLRGRGVALYIKEDLRKKYVKEIVHIDTPDVQAILIKCSSLVIGGVYVPPSADTTNVVSALKLELHAKKKKCIIMGDLNFDFQTKHKHPIRTSMTAQKYDQLIKLPTHYSGNLIDQIYKKGHFQILEWRTFPSHYSDHMSLAILMERSELEA